MSLQHITSKAKLFARSFARSAWLYMVLIVAAAALFYLAFNLSNAGLPVLLAAAIVFVCIVLLFIAARSRAAPIPTQPDVMTTLLSPTVLVNEIRAAALVTYGQIGVVTIKKERAKSPKDSVTGPLRDKLFSEVLVMDVGVRVVAGVNLKHMREADVCVDADSESVEITLPPTKVLMVYVDESLTRVIAHKSGWFTARDISLMDAARREAMDCLVNAAIEKDVLDKAGEQAAATIAAIARRLGYDDVRVYPTLPPIGQHFEELQDPALIAKIKAERVPLLPREDQAGD